jgi:hypothetical protein
MSRKNELAAFGAGARCSTTPNGCPMEVVK